MKLKDPSTGDEVDGATVKHLMWDRSYDSKLATSTCPVQTPAQSLVSEHDPAYTDRWKIDLSQSSAIEEVLIILPNEDTIDTGT